ncbi:NADH-quinone oxidoreductase subunit C [Brevibacillus sp. GCM10020057]|uniref:NADH-quinone oxidoreductase subunit C n=1 Tax=Brevibacillus sp. GCM10020057 TaxID=3317327 RepID=UPI00363E7B22
MSDEKRKPTPEEKAKAAAEARAKAEALRKLREQEAAGENKAAEGPAAEGPAQADATQVTDASAPAEAPAAPTKPVSEMTPEEKKAAKAAAAAEALAKAKAAKEAKEAGTTPAGADADAKAKAAAAAKAKAAAAAAAKAKAAREAGGAATDAGDAGSDDAKAKAAAAAKAKAAAAAAAKAKAAQGADGAGAAEEAPKAPSKNQPFLDKYVSRITEAFGADVLEASYINELAKEVPTLVIKNERWQEVASFLKEDEQLAFDYLSDLHGVDYDDRMEVYYHFYSYKNRQNLAVKVKTDRENPTVPSVMGIWQGANWNEREAFDLLGIHFPGHRDMRRILLPDDWVGYPLRKDYVQYDEEV